MSGVRGALGIAMFTVMATGLLHLLVSGTLLALLQPGWSRLGSASSSEIAIYTAALCYLLGSIGLVLTAFPLGASRGWAGIAGAIVSLSLGACAQSLLLFAFSLPMSVSLTWPLLLLLLSPSLSVLPALVMSLVGFARSRRADIEWKERCDQDSLLVEQAPALTARARGHREGAARG